MDEPATHESEPAWPRFNWLLAGAFIVATTPLASLAWHEASTESRLALTALTLLTTLRVGLIGTRAHIGDRPVTSAEGNSTRSRALVISGLRASALLGASLALAATLLPHMMRLPALVEVHAVLIAWWIIGSLCLWQLMHNGRTVTDDHSFSRLGILPPSAWKLLQYSDPLGCSAFLGEFALALMVLYVVFVGILAIDALVPALAFLVYVTIRSALSMALEDALECRDRAGRALIRATTWSALHLAPVALAVELIRRLASDPW